MFSSRAIGRLATPRLLNARCVRSQWLPTPSAASIAPRVLRPTVHIGNAATKTSDSCPRDAYTYPENLNIYDCGWSSMAFIGFTRAATMVFAGYGILWAGPSVLFGSNAPLYMMPVYAILPTLPMIATGILFGGYVLHINIWLPRSARKSKEALIRFASNIPPSTVMQIKSLWFAPWPHTREVQFRDLRKLKSSWTRLTNLEHQPLWSKESTAQAQDHPFWAWSAKSWMGRFFVRERMRKDRSRVSGVWQKMWEQIPMDGQKAPRQLEVREKGARKVARTGPASARNR